MTCTAVAHTCIALPLALFDLMGAVEQTPGGVRAAVRQCEATRRYDGKFASTASPVTVPLCYRKAKSARVGRGNRTRRIAEMRCAREAMERAPDYPKNLHVEF
jgi:hypothetical protein